MQGLLISILARIVWLTLSLTRPNVTWLKLSLVVCSLASVWCVHLIQVFIEPLLALQASQVPCCILIFRYAVLGNCTCTNLTTILPVALWKQINTKFVSFLSSEFETPSRRNTGHSKKKFSAFESIKIYKLSEALTPWFSIIFWPIAPLLRFFWTSAPGEMAFWLRPSLERPPELDGAV